MKIEELKFTHKELENKIYPSKQLVHKFFVSHYFVEQAYVEVRPITFGNLIYAALKNYIRIWYWSFTRTLWKIGFIDIPDYEALSWKRHFRFNFWSPKKYA